MNPIRGRVITVSDRCAAGSAVDRSGPLAARLLAGYAEHVLLRDEIDALNDVIGPHLNQGVYHAGFATTQDDYEAGYREVFETLDLLEDLLGDGREFLVGGRLTEADVRLWPTLVRFDPVYVSHFKLNRNRLVDFEKLWAYARRLHAIPAFRTTTDSDQIRRHYYGTQRHINPTGIVPPDPRIDWSL